MEIELPDGTVLDAPDDADIKSVVSGYRRAQLRSKNPAEYDPSSQQFKDKYGPLSKGRTRQVPIRGMGMVEQPEDDTFTEGIGSGMVRMTRGLGNIQDKVLNKHPLVKAIGGAHMPNRDFYSDEAIQSQDATDEPLAESGKGMLGQVLGQTAVAYGATGPLGGLSGASTGSSMLGRTLAHPTTRAALEGAVAGAGAARQDEQGEGGLKGAILSATLERMFGLGGRAIRGLVKKSDSTEALQQLAGQQGEEIFVPISQAAGDQDIPTKLARIAYSEGLSLVPGVRGQLTKQSEGATEKFRELAIREATPEGTHLPPRPGQEVQESLASIRQGFDENYARTIDSLDFTIPGDLRRQLATKIKQANENIDAESMDKAMMLARGLLQRFGSKGKIEGSNLRIVLKELQDKASKAPEYEAIAYRAAREVIEDMIPQRLRVQGLYDQYADLEEPARHLVGLERAASAARPNSGRFSPGQLARSAQDPTQLDLAQTAGQTLKGSPAGTSFAGRSVISGAATLGGLLAEPTTAGTILVGANLLATKTAQKALMGDTAAQRTIIEILKNNPEAAGAVERALRQAAATSGAE